MKIEKETSPGITALIVDITNVLFRINEIGILQEVGIFTILWYVLTTWKNPETTCLKFLDAIPPNATPVYPPIYYKQYRMPDCITANILGRISAYEVCTELKKDILCFSARHYFRNKQEEEIITRLIEIMFNPARIMKTMRPNKPFLKLLRTIKNKSDSYKFFLLTNIGSDIYQALTQQYPAVFDLFDGAIISSHVGELKPYPAMYHTLLNTYNLSPETSVFIDDQEDNAATARELGFNTIVYRNAYSTRKELVKLGIISD
jgi:FMN phosphatase YigB (HAD superfamily)